MDSSTIVLPDNDSRCANILRTVINNLKEKERESDSRFASSSNQGYPNKVYALRQKMFGSYLPSSNLPPLNRTDSRSASIVGEPIRNKVFALRRVMFGSYS